MKIVKVNFKSLKDTFNEMDNEKGVLGLTLIKEAEYMKKTLVKLKKEIDGKGLVVEMDQGKYTIERANPALSPYNTLIKNYQSIIKQINDLLPEIPNDPEDNFDEDEL